MNDPRAAEYRRRLRRRLVLWSLPAVAVVLLVALKLLSMPVLAGVAQAGYASGNFERTVAASDALTPADVFEPWVRHFDRGTGLARIGVLVDARSEFERALGVVPRGRTASSCMIRTDLVLVVEEQGDSAVLDSTYKKAAAFYKHALALIAASPTGCFHDLASTAAPPSQKPLDDAKSRLDQKRKQAEQQAGGSTGKGGTDTGRPGASGGGSAGKGGQGGQGKTGGGTGQGGSSTPSPLDRLKQKDGSAEKQQQQQNDRNRYLQQNPEQYSGTPW